MLSVDHFQNVLSYDSSMYGLLVEVLNLNPAVKKAIILLLYHTLVEVLKI